MLFPLNLFFTQTKLTISNIYINHMHTYRLSNEENNFFLNVMAMTSYPCNNMELVNHRNHIKFIIQNRTIYLFVSHGP